MSRPLRWSQLLPGLLVALALAAGLLAVLLFARVGAAKGETMRVYTAVGSVRGIMRGSEVWLAGMPVGLVRDVEFLPPSAPPERRLLIALDVGERFRPFIRADVAAQIRPGGSLIGSPVVHLSGGTPAARALAAGDTILAREQADFEGIASEFGLAARELPLIMQNVRLIGQHMRAATGTIGAFTADESRIELGGLQARGARIAGQLSGGRGTLGRAFGGREALAGRARSALAGVDSIRALMASGRGELGRFRRDSTLLRTIGGVRDEVAIVRALLDEPRGTAGRVLHDRAIQLELARADTAMQQLFADVKARPLRYINLF